MRKIILSAFLLFITVVGISQNRKQENNSPAPALMNEKDNTGNNSQTKSNQNAGAPALMNTNTETAPAENSAAAKTAEPKLAVGETNENSSQYKNTKKNTNTDSKPK